jgi:PAS domain S-box-containing protein
MTVPLRLVILSVTLVSLGLAAQVAVQTPRAIRVVLDNAYAPYSFQLDDSSVQGILVDQWHAWEKKTGIKVDIYALDWGDALRRMRAGEFDVIDSIVETAERREYFDFTPSYATVKTSIIFRNDISGITDLASLKGFAVGVKAGDQHVDTLAANGVTTVVPFRNNEEIIEAAKEHKINVFVVDAPSAVYLLNKMGVEADFRTSAPLFRDELRRAVRKGDATLLRIVSEGFAAVEPRELTQIDEKWFGRTFSGNRRYLTYAGYATVAATLLAAGLAGWNRSLRKGILQRTAALAESEQRFRQFTENIREVFWMTTSHLEEVVYVSPAYESVWGRSLESLHRQPRSFMAAIHGEDRERVVSIIEGQREQGFEVEYRIVRPDGSVRWIRDRGFPVKDTSGKVYRVAGIAADITERKHADEALRQSEFELAEAQRVASLGSWSLDIATGTVRWSEELFRIFDVDKAAFGDTYDAFLSRVHPDDRSHVLAVNAEARSSGKPFVVEYRVLVQSGRLKHVRELGFARTDSAGVVCGLFGTAQDITERKLAENALRDSGIQLQALSRRLVELQEHERKELARELHDRVGQNLTALRINLEILQPALASQGNDDIRTRVADSAVLLESTMGSIEDVMSELRPPMLDTHGLLGALQWHARNFSKRTGTMVAVHASVATTRPAPQVEIALFRIAQEALNNVAKHARAGRVDITLDQANGECVMSVCDDGIGFDGVGDTTGKAKAGLGIVTMRERSQAVGGRFEVRALPERGTQLTVRVPY